MKDPRIWIKAVLFVAPLPVFLLGNTYAVEAIDSIEGEILLSTYEEKQNELEKYHELREILSDNSEDKQVVDKALLQLLSTKIDLVKNELVFIKDQFWTIPLEELVNHSLPQVNYPVDNVDMEKVKEAWLTWVNDLRASK